jgi:hypothetical protein
MILLRHLLITMVLPLNWIPLLQRKPMMIMILLMFPLIRLLPQPIQALMSVMSLKEILESKC